VAISAHYEEIARCNRCGFCQAACPIFRSTGHEAGVARGRLALLRALVEGRLEWGRDLEEPLFACLLCGACTAHCFPALPTADLVVAAREEYQERVGRKRLHRLLFEHLLPYPNRLRVAARAAALGKASGLSAVAKALGLLRCLGRDLPRAEGIADFPKRPLRHASAPRLIRGTGDGPRVAYFAGCGMDILCPDAARASLRLLARRAGSVVVLENVCCGLPAYTYGDRRAAASLARRNLEIIRLDDFDLVVTDCSSCAAFLREKYPTLFGPEDPARVQAERLAGRTQDLVAFLAAQESEPSPSREGGRLVVTYHDPCHASRGQGLVREPRALLRALEWVEYRELPEADWCCGGAGSYALAHYDLAMKVLDRKMDNLAATGADVLATSCPACIVQLRYGVRSRGLEVRVCHLSELLAPEA